MPNWLVFAFLNILFWIMVLWFNRYKRPADPQIRRIQLIAVLIGSVGILLGAYLLGRSHH